MRRNELESHDPAVFAEVARDAEFGELGLLTADGTPRVVPLNFAAVGDAVYFHGALEGEKWDCLQADPRCSFSMVKAYSLIPSDWTTPRYACPATHFYKSVELRGRCELADDLGEKARALQAIMEKYQPEGGFDEIRTDNPIYAKALRDVAVFRVTGTWTAGAKFGQNEAEHHRRNWIAKLRERGEGRDLATALEIEKALEDSS